MSESPFFSVVIPVYNREALVGKAIQSVLDQSFPDFEIIIIDDGSTDNSAAEVKKFNDPRVKYFYQQNQERSVARNNGIKFSAGKYICFLDSDDYYSPLHLEVLHKNISLHQEPVALFCTGATVEGGGNPRKLSVYPNDGNPVRYIFFHKLDMNTVCVHREIFETYRFNEKQVIGEDTNLWLRIASRFPVIGIHEYTTFTVIHSGSGMEMYYKRPKVKEVRRYAESAVDFYRQPEIRKHISKKEMNGYLLKKYRSAAYSGIFARTFSVFFYSLLNIILLDPGFLFTSDFFKMMKEFAFMSGRIMFRVKS